jgi:hypothetical protein
MDIEAALDFMRTCNRPCYGAWEVCKAAGVDAKRQARLFARPEIVQFMEERGLMYGLARTKSRRCLAAVISTEGWDPERVAKAREQHARAIQQSTENARESRSYYKKRSKVDEALELAKAAEVVKAVDETEAYRNKTLQLFQAGKLTNLKDVPFTPPEHAPLMAAIEGDRDGEEREGDVATTSLPRPDLRRARLLVRQAEDQEWNRKWEAGEAERIKEAEKTALQARESACMTATMRQNKRAAEAAYAAGLVARVHAPDPEQLSLLDLIAA